MPVNRSMFQLKTILRKSPQCGWCLKKQSCKNIMFQFFINTPLILSAMFASWKHHHMRIIDPAEVNGWWFFVDFYTKQIARSNFNCIILKCMYQLRECLWVMVRIKVSLYSKLIFSQKKVKQCLVYAVENNLFLIWTMKSIYILSILWRALSIECN